MAADKLPGLVRLHDLLDLPSPIIPRSNRGNRGSRGSRGSSSTSPATYDPNHHVFHPTDTHSTTSDAPHQSPPPSISDSNRELLSVLSTPSPHRRALPQELILQILSHPSRWILAWKDNIAKTTRVDSVEGTRILLRTPPLTARSARLLRKVVFTIRSHDQGWSSFPENRDTFENTWTWFDAAVASKSAELTQSSSSDDTNLAAEMQDGDVPIHLIPNIRRLRIQSNRHAVKRAADYRISISRGQEMFDTLKVGDQILLVACAQYGGWSNIEDAGIEMWEEDDLNEFWEEDV